VAKVRALGPLNLEIPEKLSAREVSA
jgi:hypothetical protein